MSGLISYDKCSAITRKCHAIGRHAVRLFNVVAKLCPGGAIDTVHAQWKTSITCGASFDESSDGNSRAHS